MVQFDSRIFTREADRRARAGERDVQALQNLAQTLYRQELMEDEKLRQERLLAEQRQYEDRVRQEAQQAKLQQQQIAQAQDPANIYAMSAMGQQLTPEQQARYQFAQQKSGKMIRDEMGNVVEFGKLPTLPSQQQPMAQHPMAKTMQGGLSPKGQVEREKLMLEEQFRQRKAEQEKLAKKPLMERSFRFAKQSFENIGQEIDKAIDDTDWSTSGLGGSLTGWIAGTPAANLRSTLQTIQADSAFDTLQSMRDNSPTGGALGAISERELSLLQNARVALDQSQTPSQLKENLSKYRNLRKQALNNVAEAYKNDYGEYPQGFAPSKQSDTMDSVIEELPQGAKQIGTSNGKPVYETPDGRRFIQE